jgi:hypothetical protein
MPAGAVQTIISSGLGDREETGMKSGARLTDTQAKLEIRLDVIGDKVLCPRSCEYRPVEGCVTCSELTRIEPEAVVCHPQVDRATSDLILDMMILDVLLGPGL